MRTCLCLCALLVPSAAWAENIPVAASVTYLSDADLVAVDVAFRETIDPEASGNLLLTLRQADNTGEFVYWAQIANTERYGLYFWSAEYRSGQYSNQDRYPIDHEFRGNHFVAEIPFEMFAMRSPEMLFGVQAGSGVIEGVSHVDRAVTYVPEPSSVALASLGVVALLVHLRRRPGLRVGRAERHRRGEVER